MSITAESPKSPESQNPKTCSGCAGAKGAPIAAVVFFDAMTPMSMPVKLVLCEECGPDAANAIGFMCVKDGGWSKIVPRKRKAARP